MNIKFTIEKLNDGYRLCGEDHTGKKKYAALKTNKEFIVDIAKNSIIQSFKKKRQNDPRTTPICRMYQPPRDSGYMAF